MNGPTGSSTERLSDSASRQRSTSPSSSSRAASDLGTGAIRIVLTSLAHASFGGVIGYFLGRQKFEPRPIWWMPAGVALAATLNGVFFFLRSTVGRGAIEGPLAAIAPWIGLVLAAILAAAVTAVLSTLIRRELAHSTEAGAGAGVAS